MKWDFKTVKRYGGAAALAAILALGYKLGGKNSEPIKNINNGVTEKL